MQHNNTICSRGESTLPTHKTESKCSYKRWCCVIIICIGWVYHCDTLLLYDPLILSAKPSEPCITYVYYGNQPTCQRLDSWSLKEPGRAVPSIIVIIIQFLLIHGIPPNGNRYICCHDSRLFLKIKVKNIKPWN